MKYRTLLSLHNMTQRKFYKCKTFAQYINLHGSGQFLVFFALCCPFRETLPPPKRRCSAFSRSKACFWYQQSASFRGNSFFASVTTFTMYTLLWQCSRGKAVAGYPPTCAIL